MKKLTKYEIASAIEKLPGNVAWGSYSNMTLIYDVFTRDELVDIYNSLVVKRHLDLSKIA